MKEPAMTHIALDSQDEAIKRFVLSLPVDPQGAILELNGRAVVHVLPISEGNGDDTTNGTWTEEKNAQRCALIDREIEGTLTPKEAAVLNRLQQDMLRHRRRVAPLPLADARKLHQELLAKAQRSAPDE
jgi:hypothetical protein